MKIRKIPFSALVVVACGSLYLGLADISLPYDKWLHFSMFFVMSLLFYWIWNIKSLRFVRNLSLVVCTLFGAIGSEFLQHLLAPSRTFDPLDILANMAGSVIAIGISNIFHSYWLKRRKKQRRLRTINWNLESRIGMHFEESDTEDTEPNIPLKSFDKIYQPASPHE